MTKLKVGDRVRVTQEGKVGVLGLKEHNAKLGEEGTIIEIMFGELLIVDFGRHFPENGLTSQALESHELEKVEG